MLIELASPQAAKLGTHFKAEKIVNAAPPRVTWHITERTERQEEAQHQYEFEPTTSGYETCVHPMSKRSERRNY